MTKSKILNCIAGLCFFWTSTAIGQEAIVCAGGGGTGSTGSFCYSSGLVNYATCFGSGGTAGPAILQSDHTIFFLPPSLGDACLSVSIYPNTAIRYVELWIDNAFVNHLSYAIYDLTGKLLLTKTDIERSTRIDLGNYPPATYFITITTDKNEQHTFRILKTE